MNVDHVERFRGHYVNYNSIGYIIYKLHVSSHAEQVIHELHVLVVAEKYDAIACKKRDGL